MTAGVTNQVMPGDGRKKCSRACGLPSVAALSVASGDTPASVSCAVANDVMDARVAPWEQR